MRADIRVPFFFAVLLAVALVTGCEQKKPEPAAPASTNQSLSAAAGQPQFARLTGKWARTDGDYLLEIKSVEKGGQMDATYNNPNPIKVSRALGISEGKETKVFVELRDEGYPGCTYSLTYSPESDQLFGTYFQAAMQQTYEVVFSRLK